MKTSHQIRMDYNRTISLTNELDHLADRLSKEINENTSNNLRALLSGWEGENSSEFASKISAMQGNSQDTVKAIKQIAEGIRSNAKMVYNAEMEALRLINTRSYK